MRRTGMMLLLGAVVAAGAASAHAVIVDFGTLGGSSASITGTSNPAGLTLNGVTMLYDDQGEDEDDVANPVTAQVVRFGIFGSAAGKLILDLGPATGMTLGFSLLTVTQPEDLPDALIAIFSDGDVVTMGATPDSQGDAFGTLAYTSPAMRRQAWRITNAVIWLVMTRLCMASLTCLVAYEGLRIGAQMSGSGGLAAGPSARAHAWQRSDRRAPGWTG